MDKINFIFCIFMAGMVLLHSYQIHKLESLLTFIINNKITVKVKENKR